MDIADALTLAALAALAAKLVSTLKYMLDGDVRQFGTQVVVWLVSVVVVMVAAQADIASGIAVGDMPLSSLDVWSQVLVGLQLGASASFAYDVKKAVDRSDSAVEPPLSLTGRSGG